MAAVRTGREEGREHTARLEGLGTLVVEPDAPEASPQIPKHPRMGQGLGKPGCSQDDPC